MWCEWLQIQRTATISQHLVNWHCMPCPPVSIVRKAWQAKFHHISHRCIIQHWQLFRTVTQPFCGCVRVLFICIRMAATARNLAFFLSYSLPLLISSEQSMKPIRLRFDADDNDVKPESSCVRLAEWFPGRWGKNKHKTTRLWAMWRSPEAAQFAPTTNNSAL